MTSTAQKHTPALPNCPFCGAPAEHDTQRWQPKMRAEMQERFLTGHAITCSKCEAEVGVFDTMEEAVTAWTRRDPLIVRLVNLYNAGKAEEAARTAAITARGDIPPDLDYGLTEGEQAAASMMNALLTENEALLEAARASEREYENLEDRAPADAGCIECTLGTVPNDRNTGLCAHHLRRAAIAKAEDRP